MKTLEAVSPITSPCLDRWEESSESLTASVANLIDLHQQVKQAHWNTVGAIDDGLHLLFARLANELDNLIDVTAERQHALGFHVRGSLQDAVRLSSLKPFPFDFADADAVIGHLIGVYRHVANSIHKVIGPLTEAEDYATADIYTDCLEMLDDHLFLLTSHL